MTYSGTIAANRQVLPILLLVCLASAFFLRPEPVWALTFYLGVLPAVLYRLWHGPIFNPWNANIILVGVLLAWSAMTLIWGENPGGWRVPKFLCGTVWTGLFFVAVMTTLQGAPHNERAIGSTLIAAGGANAALSVLLYLVHPPPDGRLIGWAETRHSILGALVIGVCYLFAADRALRETALRPYNIAVASLCLCFVILTDSRGPLVSVLIATLILFADVSLRTKARIAIGAGLAAAALFVLQPSLPAALLHAVLERGTSHRLQIWSFTLQRVEEQPWLGHGLAAYLGLSADFTFPHDLYLSALFYSGIVGFFLLMALIGSVTWGLVRARKLPSRPLLLALWIFALCGGLTDLGQVTKGPGSLWLIFWLPLGMACAALTGPPLGNSTHPRV
jgi:O-antigen ligase